MQTPTPAPSQPAKSNPIVRILAIIGGIVVACCVLSVLGVAVMRLLRPKTTANTPQETRPPATAQPVIGATVEYHAPTATIGPTATKAPILGKTRDQPLPMDSKVDIGGGMQLSIVFVTRPADEIVNSVYKFNSTPAPDQEYLLVALHIDCTKNTNDKCIFLSTELKTVGADGIVQDEPFVVSVPNRMDPSKEFFGGSSIEGSMVFLVRKDDTSVVLFHDPLFFGNPVYIALQK